MLKLTDVRVGYGGDDVVRGVDLALPRGDSLAIIGPNGCGKTTLLRAIAGLLPHKGQIQIDGHDIGAMKPRALAAKVAMLGQISPVYFSYTVYDAVLMGRYAHSNGLLGVPTAADRAFVENCLRTVDLHGADVRNRSLKALSGGQLQRVFLARTLAQDPQIVLLDEPTNHLDLKFQLELVEYLKDWAMQQNRTIIGVLHDISLAMRLSPNVLMMKDGQIANGDISRHALMDVYEMDVASAMRENLRIWEKIT